MTVRRGLSRNDLHTIIFSQQDLDIRLDLSFKTIKDCDRERHVQYVMIRTHLGSNLVELSEVLQCHTI
jgi:hypothetical protein